jgi:hypothetical protein
MLMPAQNPSIPWMSPQVQINWVGKAFGDQECESVCCSPPGLAQNQAALEAQPLQQVLKQRHLPDVVWL